MLEVKKWKIKTTTHIAEMKFILELKATHALACPPFFPSQRVSVCIYNTKAVPGV